MNLLTDGMIEKSVIKTPLNKQLRIDSHTATYEVYDIRLDHLYFNDQNDRIATWMSKYKAEHDGKSVDMSDLEAYNQTIEDFIVASNPQTMRATKNNIRAIGQQEYGVVLNDGRIIDGNRRFTCLRQIQRESGQTQYFKAVILPHDIENNAKQIKMLELSLQLGVDKAVDYDPIDRLVGLYHAVEETHLLTVEEYASNTNTSVRAVKEDLEKAKLMIEYLEFLNAPKQYHLVKELKLSEPLTELQKILSKFSYNDDRKEDIKSIVFANFTVLPEGDKRIYIRKISKIVKNSKFLDGFIDDQMEMTEELVDKIDKHKTVTEKVINNELRTYGTVDRFSQSTEKWLAKTQSDSSRNQPAQLIDKAYNAIDSIDTNIFLKLSDEQIGVVVDKLDKLSNIIEQVRSELDV